MRNLILLIACVTSLQGCAYYLTQRPPIMERKMGSPFGESVGVLATSADYRVVYVQIKPGSPICAEPPPDVAGQFASAFAASLSGTPADRPMGADVESKLAVSMKQLVMRSQGLQHFRDSATDLCIDMTNGYISQQYYAAEKSALRLRAFELIKLELQYVGNYKYDAVAPPAEQSVGPKRKSQTSSTAEGAAE